MATNEILIDGVQNAAATADNLYTSPANGGGTKITSFTATLVAAQTETYRVFIGATAVVAKEIIAATRIAGPDYDTPLELMNQIVPAGESIFVQISTGATITVRAGGIEL